MNRVETDHSFGVLKSGKGNSSMYSFLHHHSMTKIYFKF